MERFISGDEIVIGVDEVGRGSLACEVVACACVLGSVLPDGLNDSKLLSSKKRALIADVIKSDSQNIWSIGIGTLAEIEKFNILRASMMAMERAIKSVLQSIDRSCGVIVIVDGNTLPCLFLDDSNIRLLAIVQGDKKFAQIAAASVLAKQHRDDMMRSYDLQHPEYHWRSNFGYASARHRMALQNFGASPLHRMSFLKRILPDNIE